MKKSIIALTTVLSLGLSISAVSAYARYGGGPGDGYGPRAGYAVNVDDASYKKFMDETAQIRKSLAVDQAEMAALMAAANPDPAKAREIAGRITDNREKLVTMAREANIDAPLGLGYGCGMGASGNGRGYGKGNGRHW